MIEPEMEVEVLSNVILKYEVKIPSKASDYDYDPQRPNRRFITTFVHKLQILDKITESELLNINFSSEVCSSIILAIYGLTIIENKKFVTINDVFSSTNARSGYITILKSDHNPDMFILTYNQKDNDKVIIYLHKDELIKISDLLDTKKLYNLFVE